MKRLRNTYYICKDVVDYYRNYTKYRKSGMGVRLYLKFRQYEREFQEKWEEIVREIDNLAKELKQKRQTATENRDVIETQRARNNN